MHYRGFRVALAALSSLDLFVSACGGRSSSAAINLRTLAHGCGPSARNPVGSDSCESRPRSPPVNIPYEFFLVAP
jgi:hypothetical protein